MRRGILRNTFSFEIGMILEIEENKYHNAIKTNNKKIGTIAYK